MEGYRTPIIRLPGEPDRRLICRWPTIDEKFALIDADAKLNGFGEPPGAERNPRFSARMKCAVNAVIPLIVGAEFPDGVKDEDFNVPAIVDDARYFSSLWELSTFLFRGASFLGDFGTTQDAGAASL